MQPFTLLTLSLLLLSSCTFGDWDTIWQWSQNHSIENTIWENTLKNKESSAPNNITNEITAQILRDAYSEEFLAHDIYVKIVEKYPILTEVNNIINSESNHREQVGKLLDARNITRPTDYWVYSETYEMLTKMVDSSLTGAIEAGVMIETGDIDHLLTEYKKIEDQDIRMVFENIGGGSFNHLRAFLRLAGQEKYTVTTEYSRYMKPDELNTRGPLQSKMTELLKANNLPTYGGITMGMGNGEWNHMNKNSSPENNRKMQWSGQWQGGGHGRGMNQ